MATEIAKAYVQIIPSMKGVKGQIENELGGAGDGAGKTAGSGFLSGMGGVISGGAKVLGAAATAAAGGIAAIVGESVKSFADYEQLTGGAELLFGNAYQTVAENAKNAYATVQMSQNEYLQQVNGFATGLKTALGGNEQAAAELADKIITAEADIVAATGTSQESVQNAFNGIMKGNFTMLDNLQLGITPTKEGFQEVIDKVNEWNAAQGNATEYQMGNLADMESALVDYVSMVGVSGYASAEASKTISGSVASMKSAWANMITSLTSGEDIQGSIQALVTSIVGEDGEGGVINNIMPAIETALGGVGELVKGLAPVISGVLPDLISDVLPDLMSAASELVIGLVDGLVENLPLLLDTALDVVLTLTEGLIANADKIFDGVIAIVMAIIDFVIDNTGKIIDLGIDLILALSVGLLKAIPQLVAKIPAIITSVITGLIEAIPKLWEVGKQMVAGIWQGIKNAKDEFVKNVKGFFTGIIDSVKKVLGIASPSKVFAGIGGFMADGLSVGFSDEIGNAQKEITNDVNGMINKVSGVSVGVNASVNNGYSTGFDTSALDRLVNAIKDSNANIHVYLDSKEIKAGQQRLARAVG